MFKRFEQGVPKHRFKACTLPTVSCGLEMNLLRIVSRLYVSRKRIATFGASAFLIGLLLGVLLLNFGGIPRFNIPISQITPSNYMGRGAFSSTLPEITVQINAPQYGLPVNLNEVDGYNELKSWLQITPEQEQFLSQNGFVVLRVNRFEVLAEFYEVALSTGMPILITTDAVLHVYHVLFDETLKRIEMNKFIDTLNGTINTLLTKAREEAQSLVGTPLERASKINLMYSEVAHALMQPSFMPTTIEAQQELQLILNHNCMSNDPIFWYEEDYTQYVPRGHYTENKQLEAYFKTMMWLGRMRFALLTDGVANVEQTRAGILLTWTVTKTATIYNVWQNIYEITKFFVGASDDLTFEDYLAVLNEKGITSAEQIYSESIVSSLIQELLSRSKAKILGTYAETYPWLPQEEELQRILNETAGLRFMGQRFIPDSYMFQQLVYPQVGGDGTDWRLFPKGLDVPSVLGSDLAKQILEETETIYKNYTQQIEKLRAEFKSLTVVNWTRNLYWSWLYTANTTLVEIPSESKYPTFMTTPAWGYEKLQTFEGTWTELRHDTILYAKQSYTPYESLPPSSTAYVEPYAETYRRMIGLINMTINGLTHLGLLSPDINASLTSFVNVSKLFLDASVIELEGKVLDENMQKQIREAAKTISAILSVASEKTQKAAIVADVHTDTNTRSVLEEALGNFNVLIIVYADAGGKLYAAGGPVYNYFEFTQPINQRLTDEKWREMLIANPPDPPEWTNNFAR